MSEIKVGIVGLGRLGKVHARNIAFKIPGAKLVAACSIMEAELQYAKEELKENLRKKTNVKLMFLAYIVEIP